jgi:hypothetical protein
MAKANQQKVAAEIQSMQEELQNLQRALAQWVEALIEEEKPGPKKIKQLTELKKQALDAKTAKPKIKVAGNRKKPSASAKKDYEK